MSEYDDYEREGTKEVRKLKEDIKKLINEKADNLHINVPRFLYAIARDYVKGDIEKSRRDFQDAYVHILEEEILEVKFMKERK